LDESETVEFKSSLRWDYVQQKPSKELERAIVKAAVGFMNSENGGTLIIGMSDSKEVLGLQPDYTSFKSVKPDRDGFEQAFRQILIAAIGERRCVRWVKTSFCTLLGKELCVVTVAPSSEPVFLEGEAGGQLFVRVGNSTRPFDAKEALAYARDRWGGLAMPRWHAHKPIPHPAG
jgi:predicted HTH transcriptional regulator